jgi:hypothetical protein
MKKIRTIQALCTILVLGILAMGCNRFLDLDPEYTQDAENYFMTPDDYDRALTGAYDLLQTSYLTLWIGEIASDNSIAGGESVTDTEGLHEIDEMRHDAVNIELQNIMRYYYAGVTRCNFLLENQNNIDFDGKAKIIGQTRFLRAYYYSELVKYFGDIPLIIDERLGAQQVTETPRTPVSDVYAAIEEDLKFAADNLDWTDPVKGRVTKGAALSLLGKMYLYQNKFSEAATTLEEVINSGQYALIDDFTQLFTVANEGHSETIFDVQYTGAEGGGYGCFVCLEGNAAVGFHGIRQYDGPIYATGNSYNLPTEDLYNAFDPADPRRDASVLDIDAWIAAQPNSGAISYGTGAGGHTGYYNNKYLKRAAELGLPDDDLTTPVNYIVIRYADVLLMAAEAHAQNGNSGGALNYVNQVRDRVGMPALTSSGSQLLEDIYLERRFELSGEGFRFFDLVRTGQAAQRIDGFVSGKHELFPIPQVEIDLAGGNWTQNPNY